MWPGVRTQAIAGDFGQNLGPSTLRMLQFFEQQHRGPFAQYKTFPVRREGPAGPAGIAVSGRQYADGFPGADHAIGNRRLAASRQHDIRHAVLDQMEGLANRMAGGGTGGGRGKRRPLGPKFHADLRSGGVVHHAGNGERMKPRGLIQIEVQISAIQRVRARHAACRSPRRSGDAPLPAPRSRSISSLPAAASNPNWLKRSSRSRRFTGK